MANCINSYQVARDAQDLSWSASNFAFTVQGTAFSHLAFDARNLEREARRLDNIATGYSSCSAIRSQFTNLSFTYRNLQNAYRRMNAPRNGNIAYDHRRLMNNYQSLAISVRSLNGRVVPRPYPRYPRTRPLPPRHPRTRPMPPRRGPRTRPVPPRRPTRRPPTNPPRTGRRGGRTLV